MATIQKQSVGPLAQWTRKAVSVLALAASLAALSELLQAQYGSSFTGGAVAAADAAVAALPAPTAAEQPASTVTAADESRFRALSDFVARRYRVSRDVALDLVSQAYRVGRELQVDPLLIIAVMAIESSFNPIAESVAGAKGLMQIIPKYHEEKFVPFGGAQAVFDPETNIRVGALILKEYIGMTGNLGIALQMYAGALNDTEDQYTQRVLAMKQRLQYVVSQATPSRTATGAPVRTASARNTGLPLD